MRLELEKKKSDKKNSLHTYDGRLRLRDSDEEVVDSSGAMNTRLINYNPANNILYPSTVMQSTASGMAINSMVGDGSDDASRNCGTGSLVESPLDLHYAFRNDYSVDPTHTNYSLIFPSSGYYTNQSAAAAAPYVDFNAMSIPNQTSSLLPSYSNYATNIPYNGLMSTAQTSTTQMPTNASNGSSYITSPLNTDCVHNGSIFDSHVAEDFLNNINQSSSTTNSSIAGSKGTNKTNNFDGKFNEYVNDTSKLLDVTSVSADELNCLLNDENLSGGHQMQAAVPSQNNTISGTADSSTESHAYLRFESDYANKLNANHSYGHSHEKSATAAASGAASTNDDKSNELFQKNSVLIT